MRIISGTAKGRRLVSFKGEKVRPTADRIKEALFNIIASNFGSLDGEKVLDLFAGTGNLGIEALSRGAEEAIFVDEDSESIRVIKKNIGICAFTEKTVVIHEKVESAIKLLSKRRDKFNLVFLDPPYEKGFIEKTLIRIVGESVLEEGAIVIAEHSVRETPSMGYDGLSLIDRRRYGDTEISFFLNRKPTIKIKVP